MIEVDVRGNAGVLSASSSLRRGAAAMAAIVGVVLFVPVAALAQFDHLRCFKVKDGQKFKSAIVDLTPLENPPFAVAPDCVLKGKAKELCIPVSKNVDETDATQLPVDGIEQSQAFVCYTVKCPAVELPDIVVSDQFGARTLTKLKSKKVCVPAVEGIVTTTTTTMPPATPCNGATILPLECSSDLMTDVTITAPSKLGGTCEAGSCYSCGLPVAGAEHTSAENVFSFACQQTGQVNITLADLGCDLDLYVLDASCDESAGCIAGSTETGVANTTVSFSCSAGTTYHVVVEADSSCTPGSALYTVQVETGAGLGCREDCDDGIDNDGNTDIDCADLNCAGEAGCGE